MQVECATLIDKTFAYLNQRYQESPAGTITHCAGLPAIRAAARAIDTAALGTDLVATKQACRAFIMAWRQAVETEVL